ncbi:hypothetical protein [Halomonas sp. E19]|uniref:hypothetical protein n=1 Tax=Halomonas sp. E19 TaxID=3397247 RepID=UPI004033B2EC
MVLSSAELHLLAGLQGLPVRQLIWDLNAIYFVSNQHTLKLEALADRPPTSDADRYDEASYICVHEPETSGPFSDAGEEGYWYRVLARDIRVDKVELVRSYIGTPGSVLIRPNHRELSSVTVTPADCGALITTELGILPAVQLGHSFGFSHWPELRFYSRGEVKSELDGNYEILQLGGQ